MTSNLLSLISFLGGLSFGCCVYEVLQAIKRKHENKHKKSMFTRQQEDFICHQIGEWYFQWKHRMTDNGECHKLGYAKELLKEMICGSHVEK